MDAYFDHANREAFYAEADRRLAVLTPDERAAVNWNGGIEHNTKADVLTFDLGRGVLVKVTKDLRVIRQGSDLFIASRSKVQAYAKKLIQRGYNAGREQMETRLKREQVTNERALAEAYRQIHAGHVLGIKAIAENTRAQSGYLTRDMETPGQRTARDHYRFNYATRAWEAAR